METDIRTGCEKNKEEVITTMYKELEDQYMNKLTQIKEENNQMMNQVK